MENLAIKYDRWAWGLLLLIGCRISWGILWKIGQAFWPIISLLCILEQSVCFLSCLVHTDRTEILLLMAFCAYWHENIRKMYRFLHQWGMKKLWYCEYDRQTQHNHYTFMYPCYLKFRNWAKEPQKFVPFCSILKKKEILLSPDFLCDQ